MSKMAMSWRSSLYSRKAASMVALFVSAPARRDTSTRDKCRIALEYEIEGQAKLASTMRKFFLPLESMCPVPASKTPVIVS